MDNKANIEIKTKPSIKDIQSVKGLLEKKPEPAKVAKAVHLSNEQSKYVSSYRTWGETLKNL